MGDIRASVRDAFAGAISSVLAIAYCLSYAALIFSGPLAPWLSYGVAVAFLSSAVMASLVAASSARSCRFWASRAPAAPSALCLIP
jgi:sulfate permease, SulP family